MLAILDLWTTRGDPSFLRVSPGMTPHSSSLPVFSEGCVSSAPSALRVPRGDPTCSPLPSSSSSTTSSRLLHPECQPGSSLLQEVLGPGHVGPRCPHLSPVCPGVFGSSLLSISEKQQSSQNPGVLGALGFIPDVSLMSCVTWLIPSPPDPSRGGLVEGGSEAPLLCAGLYVVSTCPSFPSLSGTWVLGAELPPCLTWRDSDRQWTPGPLSRDCRCSGWAGQEDVGMLCCGTR